MTKIKSLIELNLLENSLIQKSDERTNPASANCQILIKVGMGTSGMASGANLIYSFFKEECEKRSIDAQIIRVGDMGYCFAEPTIEVQLPGHQPIVYGYVDKKRADEIIEKYMKTGEFVEGIIPQNYTTIDD